MQHAAVQQLLTIRQPFKSQWRRLHINELFSSGTFNNIRSINSTKIVNEKTNNHTGNFLCVFPIEQASVEKVIFKNEQDIRPGCSTLLLTGVFRMSTFSNSTLIKENSCST